MTVLQEGKLKWTFSKGWLAQKYDEWAFFKGKQSFQGVVDETKAIDIVALDLNNQVLWLIEAKDYRLHRRQKQQRLDDEIAHKVRDTLGGLLAAAKNANVAAEKAFAKQAIQASKLRVVLHLEQPKNQSKLFPRTFDPADLAQKLKQRLKCIDPHPKVMESKDDWRHWSVTRT